MWDDMFAAVVSVGSCDSAAAAAFDAAWLRVAAKRRKALFCYRIYVSIDYTIINAAVVYKNCLSSIFITGKQRVQRHRWYSRHCTLLKSDETMHLLVISLRRSMRTTEQHFSELLKM